ncbi:major facilitator superfamily domain-containing protein 6-like [Amphibalanus amphitrite]|uniref:major facilitator superfamily domain-containing protein 6-like n=1 Tax=Amphibalanus amphitrite TaxID=1232801 RepID=UPI001C906901|nr:major facilitator superfamily domain-containing protein 6-like [Amphibalanus amphitrite]
MKLKVNAKLLPIKAFYFFFFGGVAPILPFLPVYARQLGISEVGVGAVYVVLPVVAALMRPVVGAIADATHRHKLVFFCLLVVTTVGYITLNFLPAAPPAPLAAAVQLKCGPAAFVKQCADREAHCHAARLTAAAGARNDTVRCELHCDRWPDCGTQSDWCRPAGGQLPLQLNLSALDVEGLCLYLPLKDVPVNGTVTHYPACVDPETTNCSLSCADRPLMKLLNGRPVDASAYYQTSQFWVFLVFLILAWDGTSITIPLADTIAFKLLDDPSKYGYQRVWGSFGWGIFSFLAGYLVDVASRNSDTKDYSPAFYLLIGMMVLNMMACTKLHVSALKEARPRFLAGLGALLVRPAVVLFVLSCCVVGTMTGLLWTFFFLHLQDVALAWDCSAFEWISLVSGLTLLVQCFLGEVPFFFISGWVIRKLGHVYTQTVVLLAFGVRFLLYSLLKNPWVVLPIELLNGLTFGLFYANMVGYACAVAPPGMTATLQGLVGASFECVGVAIGSGFGGILYGSVGGAMMFRIFGLISVAASVLYVVLHCITSRWCPEPANSGSDADRTATPDSMLREMKPMDGRAAPEGSEAPLVPETPNGDA